jgi:hypothetical protein
MTTKKVPMKNLRTTMLFAALISCLYSSAQTRPIPVNEPDLNKPKLFANLADKIGVSTEELDNLFASALGRSASIAMSMDKQSRLEGEIVSISSSGTNSVQTVIIRSTNYDGARFTLTRRQQADGHYTYTGHILSFRHGDLYELQNLQGQWTLVKRNYYDLVNE